MLSPNKKLAALAWAAAQADMSYGRFTINLSKADKTKIYKRYQTMLDKKGEKAAEDTVKTKQRKAPARKDTLKKPAVAH